MSRAACCDCNGSFDVREMEYCGECNDYICHNCSNDGYCSNCIEYHSVNSDNWGI